MTYENDHTDAEFARREHAYEMGEDAPGDKEWYAYAREVEKLLKLEHSLACYGEDEDGYSLDTAYDAFEAGITAAEYAEGKRK